MGSTSYSCSSMVLNEKMDYNHKGLRLLIWFSCHMASFVTKCAIGWKHTKVSQFQWIRVPFQSPFLV
jgi:hypothetical protein